METKCPICNPEAEGNDIKICPKHQAEIIEEYSDDIEL
jgi:hypothetical protein